MFRLQALNLLKVEVIDAGPEGLLEWALNKQLAGDATLLECGLVVAENFVKVAVL